MQASRQGCNCGDHPRLCEEVAFVQTANDKETAEVEENDQREGNACERITLGSEGRTRREAHVPFSFMTEGIHVPIGDR